MQPLTQQQDLAIAFSENKPSEPAPSDGDYHSSNGLKDTNGTGVEQEEMVIRFAEQGASMLRPASAVYGAPYDMADLSEGGAIADMLRRLQTQEPD